MKEIFKDIVGYEDYQVSNKGRVISKKREVYFTHSVTKERHTRITEEKYLKIYYNNRTGYKFVQLYKDKKSKNLTIHRLVAITFINNNDNLPCVNHIDGNKHNNIVENLEWCTDEYNHEHATRTGLKPSRERVGSSKLKSECVNSIRILLENGVTQDIISKAFNVSRSNISLIKSKKTWN